MNLFEAVKATYAVIGQEMTDLGLEAIVVELTGYELASVFTALRRCRRECRKITLADILDRIPSGHPGPEEAWALVAPTLDNEALSVVWTDEMAEAYGTARHLTADLVAARMAFKEIYVRLVAEARATQQHPRWRASLGWDPSGREAAQQEATTRNALVGASSHGPDLLADQRPERA